MGERLLTMVTTYPMLFFLLSFFLLYFFLSFFFLSMLCVYYITSEKDPYSVVTLSFFGGNRVQHYHHFPTLVCVKHWLVTQPHSWPSSLLNAKISPFRCRTSGWIRNTPNGLGREGKGTLIWFLVALSEKKPIPLVGLICIRKTFSPYMKALGGLLFPQTAFGELVWL